MPADATKTLHSIEDRVRGSSCPIVGVEGVRAELVGSGFLLQVGNQLVLVTAAHVLHYRFQYELQIPGATRTVPIIGEINSTGPGTPEANPKFGFDLGFVLLDREKMIEQPSSRIHTVQELDPDDLPFPGSVYGFVGCPASKNRRKPGRTFEFTSYYLGGVPRDKTSYDGLGHSMTTHFIMEFDRENMIARDGKRITVPDPHGMSGGPVWRLGRLEECRRGVSTPRIVGLGIAWPRPKKVLVAARVSLIFESMRQLIPGLAPHLPRPKHVKLHAKYDGREHEA